VELQVRLLELDLERGIDAQRRADWSTRLDSLAKVTFDRRERSALDAARRHLTDGSSS